MFVPDAPHLRPGWFGSREPTEVEWLADERWVPPGPKGLYARARSGLSVVAREDLPAGATVLLPAYVPRSVVRAFRAGDVSVRYYPIEPDLRLPWREVRDRIDAVEPEAVLFVHYFGFADPAFADLAGTARAVGATVIEDCARALFARDADGTLLGTTGEYALFSLHKVLPVPNGGLIVGPERRGAFPPPTAVRSEYRAAAAAVILRACETVGVQPVQVETATAGVRSTSAGPAPERTADAERPTDGPGRFSRIGLAASDPSAVAATRRRRYAEVRAALAAIDGVDVLSPPVHEGAAPFGVAVRFPEGEATRDGVYERLDGAGLPCQRLRWRLRPGELDPPAYGGARALRRQLLVVPTHHQLPRGTAAAVAEGVEAAVAR